MHKKNVIYIFGGESEDSNSTYSFELNDISKEIRSGTYFKYVLKEGEELKINKGGVLGEAYWIKWMKGQFLSFYSLSGFGLSDMSSRRGDLILIQAGKINRINNISLGLLFTHLLMQANEN